MSFAQFRQTYNSFSGVDIHVVMGEELIAEIQGISFTVTREKAPIYTMGSADPRSFSRGKRGIAGSFITVTMDRSGILGTLGQIQAAEYMANEYELPDEYRVQRDGTEQVVKTPSVGASAGSVGVSSAQVPGGFADNAVRLGKVRARPQYHDQIMPFTITLAAGNEYGHVAEMHILGVEIMNAGSGVSVDDTVIDEACTFVCTQIRPWNHQRFIRDDPVDTSGRLRAGLAGGGLN